MTGQSLGGFIQTLGALGFGLGLSLSSSWKFGLCLLAAVPILSVGEMLNMKNLGDGGASAITDATKKSSSVVSEAVQMIRDVQAFGLEKRIAGLYDTLLIEPSRAERNESMRAGATFGISQAVTMGFYGYAFWLGGYFINKGELTFIDFMKSSGPSVSAPPALDRRRCLWETKPQETQRRVEFLNSSIVNRQLIRTLSLKVVMRASFQ